MRNVTVALMGLIGVLFIAGRNSATYSEVSAEKLKALGVDVECHKCLSVADGDTITVESPKERSGGSALGSSDLFGYRP